MDPTLRIRQRTPSLTHDQDVLIMAFFLQQNGYPPSAKELTYNEAENSSVPLRCYGK
jgi:hypothetical protein